MTDPPLRADARRNRARILAAAEEIFTEFGPSASTEQVASRAGVAIGTVFRHFPTKLELLQAVIKELLRRLTDEVDLLRANANAATALFDFFTRMVERAAANKTVVDLLAKSGIEIEVTAPVQTLRTAIEALLTGAKQAGTVRAEVRLDEVMALLAATSQGAVQAGWNADLQHRTLAIVFAGLSP